MLRASCSHFAPRFHGLLAFKILHITPPPRRGRTVVTPTIMSSNNFNSNSKKTEEEEESAHPHPKSPTKLVNAPSVFCTENLE